MQGAHGQPLAPRISLQVESRGPDFAAKPHTPSSGLLITRSSVDNPIGRALGIQGDRK